MTERRYALKVCYEGRGFSGSQRQPVERTVEGEFLSALDALKINYADFKAAGRTDRGVSALGNVFSFTTDSQLVKARILNSKLPLDVRVTAVQRVESGFNPRHAVERAYKYFLPDVGFDLALMKTAAKLFIGEQSFHNFSVADDRNPVRRITRIEVEKKDAVIVLTFAGESFLWQMVRRMTTALGMAGRGEISQAEIIGMFDPDVKRKIPPSAPENLVLWDTRYISFKFTSEKYSRRLLEAVLKKRLVQMSSQKAICTEALKEIKK
ncbi:tRNA pseudouridine synthase A [archaeon BMS3Abin16]|nr:tRNA pseudouridine synthase A [archaeon BMS3Abin16]